MSKKVLLLMLVVLLFALLGCAQTNNSLPTLTATKSSIQPMNGWRIVQGSPTATFAVKLLADGEIYTVGESGTKQLSAAVYHNDTWNNLPIQQPPLKSGEEYGIGQIMGNSSSNNLWASISTFNPSDPSSSTVSLEHFISGKWILVQLPALKTPSAISDGVIEGDSGFFVGQNGNNELLLKLDHEEFNLLAPPAHKGIHALFAVVGVGDKYIAVGTSFDNPGGAMNPLEEEFSLPSLTLLQVRVSNGYGEGYDGIATNGHETIALANSHVFLYTGQQFEPELVVPDGYARLVANLPGGGFFLGGYFFTSVNFNNKAPAMVAYYKNGQVTTENPLGGEITNNSDVARISTAPGQVTRCILIRFTNSSSQPVILVK